MMNNTISASDVRAYVSAHLSDVFETMLSMKAEPVAAFDPTPFSDERVSGSVGLAGEAVTGSVYLHLNSAFARQATAAMLGLAPEEITGHVEINDVVGEVTNMVGGGLKSWLCDAGATCVLTSPAVIHGTSFAVNAKPGVELIQLGFKCGDQNGLVEIHMKFS
jgi:chemotaxis protein CheX